MKRFGFLLACSLLLSLSVSCGGPQKESDPPPLQQAAALPFDTASPAGTQLAWYLSVLNNKVKLDEAMIEAHFHQVFKEAVPTPAMISGTDELIALGPFSTGTLLKESPTRIEMELNGSATTMVVVIAVEESEPHAIQLLGLSPKAKTDLDVSTPLGTASAWALQLLEDESITNEEIITHFTASFIEAVPVEMMKPLLEELRLAGPFKLIEVKDTSEFSTVLTIEGKDATRLFMVLSISPEQPEKIEGLMIQPAPSGEPLPEGWDAIHEEMMKLASKTQLVVSRIDPVNATCESVSRKGVEEALAIGSTFKLYVLSAVAEGVQEGRLDWTQAVVVKEALKSLPSGITQEEPEGKEIPLKEMATLMISISDNTATDHLIDLAGRDKVEGRMEATGHTNPALNTPFVKTRELFQLKLGPAETRDAYMAADLEGRRALLQELAATALPDLESALSWTKPRQINSLEWFATGEDICGVYADMVSKESQPAYKEVFEVLSVNDGGLQLDPEVWPYVGFKGGSEPGVFNLAYLLKHASGDWYMISLTWNDDEKDLGIGANPMDLVKASALTLEASRNP